MVEIVKSFLPSCRERVERLNLPPIMSKIPSFHPPSLLLLFFVPFYPAFISRFCTVFGLVSLFHSPLVSFLSIVFQKLTLSYPLCPGVVTVVQCSHRRGRQLPCVRLFLGRWLRAASLALHQLKPLSMGESSDTFWNSRWSSLLTLS